MNIRTATLNDLDAVTAVEAACFPPAEAATNESLTARVATYPEHFLLLIKRNLQSGCGITAATSGSCWTAKSSSALWTAW